MILVYFLFFGSAYLLFVILWAAYFGLWSKVLSKQLHTFKHPNENAHKKIVMIGDSAVRGVGVTDAHDSLPGLIEKNTTDTQVRVCALDGARCEEVLRTLHTLKETSCKNCDQIVILCGGMDIIKFTANEKIEHDLQELFYYAKLITPNVVFISPPNVGNAPIFLPPLSSLYSYRSEIFYTISKKCAQEHGIAFVDYFHANNTHYALDKSHPDKVGYMNLFSMLRGYLV